MQLAWRIAQRLENQRRSPPHLPVLPTVVQGVRLSTITPLMTTLVVFGRGKEGATRMTASRSEATSFVQWLLNTPCSVYSASRTILHYDRVRHLLGPCRR